jgi:transmembrane sensor
MGPTKPDNKAAIREIIKLYLAGKATEKQKLFLDRYFEYSEGTDDLVDQLSENEKSELEQRMEAAILSKISTANNGRKVLFYRLAAAAVFIGILVTVGVIVYSNSEKAQTTVSKLPKIQLSENDIDPGTNKAVLTLADGTKIDLDDSKLGAIADEGNTVVSKTNDGQIVYKMLPSHMDSVKIRNNIIETPTGGEYQVILPDGTRVWLNSSSKLEFPTAFSGKQRVVSLSGEAYFEVQKNAMIPFIVNVNEMEVQVLGTHFNIMAYGDEDQVKTTLLEGSIKIKKGLDSKILVPGQQALISSKDKIDVIKADLESAVAWKNGYFKFDKDGITSVMRQLARWYDMEVIFSGPIPKDEFSGKIRRNVKLSKALEFLEGTGLHIRIEGKRVTVL